MFNRPIFEEKIQEIIKMIEHLETQCQMVKNTEDKNILLNSLDFSKETFIHYEKDVILVEDELEEILKEQ